MLINLSIIAVHGLGSVPARAWVHKESKQNWLKDFLPDDLNHKARIMVYNHQSQWESYAFTKKFDAFAGDLLRALEDRRSSNEVCTGLIWAHGSSISFEPAHLVPSPRSYD